MSKTKLAIKQNKNDNNNKNLKLYLTLFIALYNNDLE